MRVDILEKSFAESPYRRVQKFEKGNVAKYMFLVWYEKGEKQIVMTYGTLEQYMKDYPDHNITEAYVFDGNTTPTDQDFYDIFECWPKSLLIWSGSTYLPGYIVTDSFELDGKPRPIKPSQDNLLSNGDVLDSLKDIYLEATQFAKETLSFYNQLYTSVNGGTGVGTRGNPGACVSIGGYTQSIIYQLDFIIGDINKIRKVLYRKEIQSEQFSSCVTAYFSRAENLRIAIHAIKSKLNITDKYCTGIVQGTSTFDCIIHFLEVAKKYCEDILQKPSPIGYIHYISENSFLSVCGRKIGGYDSQARTDVLKEVTCPNCLKIIKTGKTDHQSAFEKGDLVQLRSGGPIMTVIQAYQGQGN